MTSPPVFISGFRSGTTLLINLLGMHREVTPWFETKEFCEALRWLHILRNPAEAGFEAAYCPPGLQQGFSADITLARMHWHLNDTYARVSGAQGSGKAVHERYPLGNDHILYARNEAEAALAAWREAIGARALPESVAAATGVLIRTLGVRQQQLHGGAAWINKTPEISRFADGLRSALGPCRIIYLVRDGLQVVASGQRLQWGSVETLACNWKGLLERTRAALRGHEADYLELRYEELITEPVATLNRVLNFCGREPLAGQIVGAFTERFGKAAFDVSRLADRKGLSAEQIGIFNTHAGKLQAALGYAPY